LKFEFGLHVILTPQKFLHAMMKIPAPASLFRRLLIFSAFCFLVIKASLEFQVIAQGTGAWMAGFSFKWGMIFFAFIIFSLLLLLLVFFAVWLPERLHPIRLKLIAFRSRLGGLRWILIALLLIAPVWLLQYTLWGVIFHGTYLRLLAWFLEIIILTFLLSNGEHHREWAVAMLSILASGVTFAVVSTLRNVSDYPFSLGWSEGNRLWDYSVLFGSQRYMYDQPFVPYLELGRQIVGGLPFLWPHLTIAQERFWLGIIYVLPYMLLGWITFYRSNPRNLAWIAIGLWVYLFLDQGPIHPPLIFGAILVVLAWGGPLWSSILLLCLAGYYVQVSRWTWMFAPAIWIGMLELGGSPLQGGRLSREAWKRAITLGMAGLLGGYIIPSLINLWQNQISATMAPSSLGAVVTRQPLLWYRLLPNATYGYGIVVGLLIAITPLVVLLTYLAVTCQWALNAWKKLAILLPLLVFVAVGLVASVKIGGGGDLHNVDMFLIGLLFTAAIAWRNGGSDWFGKLMSSPFWIKALLIILLVIPAFNSLMSLRPLAFSNSLERLSTLTDTENTKSLGSLSSPDVIDRELNILRDEVAQAQKNGEVLFMDQRQLLTFGYITGVPFVPEYEKKLLMDQSLSSNVEYFKGFYDDLAAHRFSLIVSEPLHTPIKDSSYQFGEENNAWVKWVANPILCYYEQKQVLKEVNVQLLVPKTELVNCSAQLP